MNIFIENRSVPVPETGCWLWLGCTNTNGYGSITKNKKSIKAHRLSYSAHNGDIPDGMQVLHKCDTPSCVNPDHLFLGTHADNMLDKAVKGRGHSPKGERHGAHRLTEKQVIEIKKLFPSKGNSEIARLYGVNKSTIRLIRTGRNWKHLE